jgi:hypothetical protein
MWSAPIVAKPNFQPSGVPQKDVGEVLLDEDGKPLRVIWTRKEYWQVTQGANYGRQR